MNRPRLCASPRNRYRLLCGFLLLTAFRGLSFSTEPNLDPYLFIDALLPSEKMPRVLNASDLATQPGEARHFVTPGADFNGDNRPDGAISGIYGFPGQGKKYFLLVGTRYSDPVRFEQLHYEEADQPFFLHLPGTTGDADPGNQAFGLSFCVSCEKGFDFYWNGVKKTFEKRPWTARIVHHHQIVESPVPELPDDKVQQALQLVGALPDVLAFVADVKARNGTLATRVRPDEKKGKILMDRAIVEIIERNGEKETRYDLISVDLKKNRVLKRERKEAGKDKRK